MGRKNHEQLKKDSDFDFQIKWLRLSYKLIIYSYYFTIRPIVSIKTSSTRQLQEYGSLKGFSDNLATLEYHWETSLEEVTRPIPKWFVGLTSGNQEKTLPVLDYHKCDQSSSTPRGYQRGVPMVQTGIAKIHSIL